MRHDRATDFIHNSHSSAQHASPVTPHRRRRSALVVAVIVASVGALLFLFSGGYSSRASLPPVAVVGPAAPPHMGVGATQVEHLPLPLDSNRHVINQRISGEGAHSSASSGTPPLQSSGPPATHVGGPVVYGGPHQKPIKVLSGRDLAFSARMSSEAVTTRAGSDGIASPVRGGEADGTVANMINAVPLLPCQSPPSHNPSPSLEEATTRYGRHPPHSRTHQPLADMVAAVISDGKFSGRLDVLLGITRAPQKDDSGAPMGGDARTSTNGGADKAQSPPAGWLQGTFHTFLMFDGRQQASRDAAGMYGVGLSVGGGAIGKADAVADAEVSTDGAHIPSSVTKPFVVTGERAIPLGKGVDDDSSMGGTAQSPPATASEFSPALLHATTTVEFIAATDRHRIPPSAAWKPWSVVLFLSKGRTQRFLQAKEAYYHNNDETRSSNDDAQKKAAEKNDGVTGGDATPHATPLWYAILDDDVFAYSYNLAYALEPFTSMLRAHHELMVKASVGVGVGEASPHQQHEQEGPPPPLLLYGGHRITYCPNCNPKKRFPFVFGGSGIFMSRDAVMALGMREVVAECRGLFAMIAGDEQLGGCIDRSRVLQGIGRENAEVGKSRGQRQTVGVRSHYGFPATDMFNHLAYDTPRHTINTNYLGNKAKEQSKGASGDRLATIDEGSLTTTLSDGYLAEYLHVVTKRESEGGGGGGFGPFPISFHHVKDATEIRLLSTIGEAWTRIVRLAKDGAASCGTASIRHQEGSGSILTPQTAADASSSITSGNTEAIIPWLFVAGALVGDGTLIRASITQIAAEALLMHGGSCPSPSAVGSAVDALAATIINATRRLLVDEIMRSAIARYNEPCKLFPEYLLPDAIAQRLQVEEYIKQQQLKKQRGKAGGRRAR